MIKNFKLFKQIIDEINYILEKPQKRRLVFVFFTIVASSTLELLGVTAILPFVQAIVSPDQLMSNKYIKSCCQFFNIHNYRGLLVIVSLGIIMVYIFKNAFILYANYVQTDFLTSLQHKLSVKMLDSYLNRPYSFFLDTNSAVIRIGCLSSIVSFRDTIGTLLTLFTEVLTTILIGCYLIYADWFTALGTLFVLGIILVSMVVFFKPLVKKAGNTAKAADIERTKSISQAVEGIKDILVTRRKEYFVEAFDKAANDARIVTRTYTVLSDCPNRVTEGICVSGIIGIVCVRMIMGDEGMAYFIPRLASFAMAAFKILPSVGKIANGITSIVYNRPFESEVYKNICEAQEYERISSIDATENISPSFEFDYERIDRNSEESALEIGRSDFVISLRGIEWKYRNQHDPVLRGLSLNINKGESIGIIGSSGAGKTTVTDIILGLLHPRKGEVTIDGRDIFCMPNTWARLVGYVPQSIYLIDDSIRANVAFGMRHHSDEKIWEALNKANLKEFVESLPNRLDTIVGERGVKFSGGQRQRVAIARALYCEPQILLLDEATAALDNETETAVLESIESLQGSITIIIVAHRLTTIRNCDKIFEITNGVAIERTKDEVFG